MVAEPKPLGRKRLSTEVKPGWLPNQDQGAGTPSNRSKPRKHDQRLLTKAGTKKRVLSSAFKNCEELDQRLLTKAGQQTGSQYEPLKTVRKHDQRLLTKAGKKKKKKKKKKKQKKTKKKSFFFSKKILF